MKEEEKKTGVGSQESGSEKPVDAVLSARDRYRQRYREAYPDLSEDDEEGFYSRANENLDELEGYRANNERLSQAFEANPALAAMLLAAKDGENPWVYLAELGGPELDIRELINDPDFGEKMTKAVLKYQENQLKGKQAQEEMQANLQKSTAALKELQAEKGMTDEAAQDLFVKFFSDIVDDGSKGIVSKETWAAVLKAQQYDADMARATEQARATAMNEKVQNPLRTYDDDMPPTLSGGAGGQDSGIRKPKSDFASFGES